MAPPLFTLGAYVEPIRELRSEGVPDHADFRIDYSGHRTSPVGRVVKVPTTIEAFSYTAWSPSSGLVTSTISALVYDVEVWDIELQAVAIYQYPESGLGSLAGVSLGNAAAVHYDADAPPPELSRLLAAERYAR